jgi:hypothetical protein
VMENGPFQCQVVGEAVMKEVFADLFSYPCSCWSPFITTFPDSHGHQNIFHHLCLPHAPQETFSLPLFFNHLLITNQIAASSSAPPLRFITSHFPPTACPL